MDLRTKLSASDASRAATILDYQPFILSDDLQTGVGYSLYRGGDERVAVPLVFRRADWSSQWDNITEYNGWLRAMYDGLLDELAKRFPGGSLLDLACNNGGWCRA
jgi:hypothetical protein